MRTHPLRVLSLLLPALPLACGDASTADPSAEGAFASNEAVLLDFELDGEVVVDARDALDPRRAVASQMFYFVGALYPKGGNARIDWVDVSNVRTEPAGEALTKIAYHAKIPVAWSKSLPVPTAYPLVLPRRVDRAGERAMYAKYKDTCTSGHDYGADNFWHDFNAELPRCNPDDADVVRARAKVTLSPENTKDTYPEYDRVWEDGTLRVVVFFGANSAPVAGDIGVADYNSFVSRLRRSISDVVATPDQTAPGPQTKEIRLLGRTQGGRAVDATVVLLERELSASTPAYDAKIAAWTDGADLVAYAGHSGLSRNVRALQKKVTVTPGRYQLLFLDGCNTAAYMDRSLHERVAAANAASDPNGTKHLDVVGNVLPSYFGHSPRALMAVLDALMAPEAPRTFNTVFEGIPAVQKVVVIGDEDNAFRP